MHTDTLPAAPPEINSAPPSSRVAPHSLEPGSSRYDAEDDPRHPLWSHLTIEFLKHLSHMVLGDGPIRLRAALPLTIQVPGGRGWLVRGRSVERMLQNFVWQWALREKVSRGAAFGGRRPYTMTAARRYRLLGTIERHLRRLREVGHA